MTSSSTFGSRSTQATLFASATPVMKTTMTTETVGRAARRVASSRSGAGGGPYQVRTTPPPRGLPAPSGQAATPVVAVAVPHS